MVKGTIKISKLFSWSRSFDVDKDENVLRIIYYPNADTELHIVPDAASIDKLKAIRDEIKAIMNRTVNLEGTVIDQFEKRNVPVEGYTKEAWIRVEE